MTPLHPMKAVGWICLFLGLSCLLMLSGCAGVSSSHSVPPPVLTVTITSSPSALEVGTTGQLTAQIQNGSAGASVTWACTPTNACGSFNPTSTASGQATTYMAPASVPTGGTVTVQASVSDTSATANINITTTATANFFVATDGSDSNPGTLAQPFLTIGKAQAAVRALPKSGQSQVTVMIRQGTYTLSQPLSFTSADSGNNGLEIIWENYPGEVPVISGGLQVTGWQSSGGQWKVTLPAGTQYFENLFYNGQRRLRAQLGASGNPPLGTYYRVGATVYLPSATTNCPDLVPGLGYECFDRFQYTSGDPISANWANLDPPSGNPCGVPAGTNGYPVGDIALYSFEQMGMSKMLINCIDTANQMIYLTGPIRFDTATSGFVPGHRYLIENARDTFKQPGQWFLDRHVTPWTLTYIPNAGENPNSDTVIIPQASQVLIATGLQHVTFQGLTFEHDNFTVPNVGYQYQRLDQDVTSAVSCQNCQNVTFDGVIITQTSGTGIDFTTTNTNQTTANNILENSAIYDVASHGVRIGLLAQNSDTGANVPQFTTVENTLIEGFGRVFAKGFGIAQGCNHDNVYTHNEIYDGYSGGINIGALNCPVGNSTLTGNNVASFNLVHNLGQGVSNDFGCVYFNTTPETVTPPSGNSALNNVCHDVSDDSTIDADGYGGQGIYIDNYTGLVDVENNLVFRVSGSTVAQTCGPEQVTTPSANLIKNNILAFSRGSIKQQGCTPSSSADSMFVMTNNLVLYDRGHVQGGCYSCLGGTCSTVLPATVNFASNMYCYTPNGNSCTLPTNPFAFFSSNDPPNQWGGCAQSPTYSSLAAWQALGEDIGSELKNPFSSGNPTNDDYSLSSSPGVGFVVFDPQEAGRTNPVLQGPAIQPTFQTNPYTASQF